MDRPRAGVPGDDSLLGAAAAGSPDSSDRGGALERALTTARRLERDGEFLGAIDLLMAAALETRAPEIEEQLVGLRHRAFARLQGPPRRERWPPLFEDPFPGTAGRPPEVDRSVLDVDLLGGGITHHGCLLVRNLLTGAQVEEAVAGIDRMFAEFDARAAKGSTAGDRHWFVPFNPPGSDLFVLRPWAASGWGLWLGDSPPMMATVLQALGDSGLLSTVEDYFGERPAMSLEKCTLRRMPPTDRITTWHQDGAFLDTGIRAVNAWIALTPCGGDADAPGLDIFPRRFAEVLESGNSIGGPKRDEDAGDPRRALGTILDVPHAISSEQADRLAEVSPPCRPVFGAGDALLFDELLPHRTGISPGMTRNRYAIEAWLFAASSFPRNYTPFVC